MAKALTKLETVGQNLTDHLSDGQLASLISRICDSPDLMLSHLDLHRKNLSLITPEVLVGAIGRVEVVKFKLVGIPFMHATAILNIAKENKLGRIKKIEIQDAREIAFGMTFDVSPSQIQQAQMNNILIWKCRIDD